MEGLIVGKSADWMAWAGVDLKQGGGDALWYCCEASMRAWMCRIMKELLVCCSFVAVSAMAVVWALTVLPILSNCSLIQCSAMWNEDSILSLTFWREDSNCCREGPGEDSLRNAVRASAITSCVGLESWALEMA